MNKLRSFMSAVIIVNTFVCAPFAYAAPIVLEVGKFAASAITGYAVDKSLEALSGADIKTHYHLEEDHDSFVLDFFSGFDGDLTSIALTFDKNWYFELAINATDFYGLSYAAVDNITFLGKAYHKENTVHDHPVKGGSVNFSYASPTGSELRIDTGGLDEYFFPHISTTNHTVKGSSISYENPLDPVNHDKHWDVYSKAKFSLFVDTRADGTPEDDILSWGFHLEAHHIPEPSTMMLMLGALIGFSVRFISKEALP